MGDEQEVKQPYEVAAFIEELSVVINHMAEWLNRCDRKTGKLPAATQLDTVAAAQLVEMAAAMLVDLADVKAFVYYHPEVMQQRAIEQLLQTQAPR